MIIPTITVMLLLGYIAQVSAWKKPSTETIIFTDLKIDDLAAIQFCMKRYNKVNVVMTGIKFRERAHTLLINYLQDAKFPLSTITQKLVVLSGDQSTRVPEDEVDHEQYFPPDPTPITKSYKDWALSALAIERDIYQIGQTHSSNLLYLSDTIRKLVPNYHLVHGYNTGQTYHKDNRLLDTKFSLKFTKQIKEWFPAATIIFTNNHHNFETPGIGQTTSVRILEGRLPESGLKFGTTPIFAYNQLKEYITDEKNQATYKALLPPSFTPDESGLMKGLKIALHIDKSDQVDRVQDHIFEWWQANNPNHYKRMANVIDQIQRANDVDGFPIEFCDGLHVAYVYGTKGVDDLIPIRTIIKEDKTRADVIFEEVDLIENGDAYTLKPPLITKESKMAMIDTAYPMLK